MSQSKEEIRVAWIKDGTTQSMAILSGGTGVLNNISGPSDERLQLKHTSSKSTNNDYKF